MSNLTPEQLLQHRKGFEFLQGVFPLRWEKHRAGASADVLESESSPVFYTVQSVFTNKPAPYQPSLVLFAGGASYAVDAMGYQEFESLNLAKDYAHAHYICQQDLDALFGALLDALIYTRWQAYGEFGHYNSMKSEWLEVKGLTEIYNLITTEEGGQDE